MSQQTPYNVIRKWRVEHLGKGPYAEMDMDDKDRTYCACADELEAILPSYVQAVAETAMQRAAACMRLQYGQVEWPTIESVLAEVDRKWKEQE